MSNSQNKQNFSNNNNKSNWNLPNVAFMVGGFFIAPPVGLATAAWLVLGKDVNIGRTVKNTYNEYSPIAKEKFSNLKENFGNSHNGNNPDNAAYQAYKAEKQAENDAKAKQAADDVKTEEQQFAEYTTWQQQAKDEASFADFQNYQKSQQEKADKE